MHGPSIRDVVLKFPALIPKQFSVRFSLPIVLITAATIALTAPPAVADTATSSNWAGYAVHRAGVRFTRVLAAWRQPSAVCIPGNQSYSAIWVGLGGFNQSSNALEQIGTEVDCTPFGSVSSSVWYELVPAPSEPVAMRVRPGDEVVGSVTVTGHRVLVSLRDTTDRQSFHKTLNAPSIDVSAAEWIVEAPSECVTANNCQTLPLADFGSTSFAFASATAVGGHSGPISDPAWGVTKIQLTPEGRRFVQYNGAGPAAGVATPSALAPGGSGFKVTFSQVSVQGGSFARPRSTAAQAGYIVHPGR
jgi:hypothetical protein